MPQKHPFLCLPGFFLGTPSTGSQVSKDNALEPGRGSGVPSIPPFHQPPNREHRRDADQRHDQGVRADE